MNLYLIKANSGSHYYDREIVQADTPACALLKFSENVKSHLQTYNVEITFITSLDKIID